jgi:Cu+-exporting ATPase
MLGYQSIDDFYDTNSILVDAKRLFPLGSVKLSGIKVFSNTKVDEVLLEAASLTTYAGSIMHQLFTDVIAERQNALYPIENFSYEESMGMCGWINNRRVLFGNREFMISHNIEGIPTKTKEAEYCEDGQEAIYFSILGNLAAMFIVDIRADREVKHWLKKLDRKKICLIIKSVDACLSLKRLSSVFGIPEEMMRIIPKKLHEDFDAETERTVRLSASMACSGKFTTLAQLILGTKVVHSSAICGLIIQTVSILLGFGLSMLLIMSKAFDYDYLSASALVIYNLICAAVTYVTVSLRKI